MCKKILRYKVSDVVKKAEFVEAGVAGPDERRVEVELSTPELRQLWADEFRYNDAARWLEERQDKILTPEAALEALRQQHAAHVAADAEKQARWAAERAKAAARAEELQRGLAVAIDTQDIAELQAVADASVPNIQLYSEASDVIREARKLLREWRDEEKRQWIERFGSEHLQRAYQAGYDCQRKYVIERAAREAPGFTVDFDGEALWSARSCPSEKALDLAQGADLKFEPEWAPEVVWLQAPPQDEVPEDALQELWRDLEEDDYEECEAVIVESYLGRYTLVQVVG